MLDCIERTCGPAGKRRAIQIGFAWSARIFDLLSMILHNRRDHVLVIVLDYLQNSLRTCGNAWMARTFNAVVGVDDDEKVTGSVLISIMCFHYASALVSFFLRRFCPNNAAPRAPAICVS